MASSHHTSLRAALLGLTILVPAACAQKTTRTITKDIAIIGGGAGGAHAAVRLREDFGKSVVVIEKQGRLGGHVNTYTDVSASPPTAYDYGVQSFIDFGKARDFFTRFNITTGNSSRVPTTPQYIDFSTGLVVNYTAPAAAARSAALAKYIQICETYDDILTPGYYKFPAGDRIPEDLLMPFSEFAVKHGIEAAVPTIFATTGLGIGNMMSSPTIHVLQAFNALLGKAMTGQQSLIVPASHNNSELYGRVSQLLGSDVLYSSTVTKAERANSSVTLTVKSADGTETHITSKRILIAIEPTLDALAPFGLDAHEQQVFSRNEYATNFAGIVTHPAMPVRAALTNTVPSAAPGNYLVFPETPFLARFDYIGTSGAGEKLFRILVIGDANYTADAAKALTQTAFDNLVKAGRVAGVKEGETLTWKAFADHGRVPIGVSPKAMRDGYFQDLYGLQGQKATWWTGSWWTAHFTTNTWAFTETVLPRLVEGL